jgi:TP901 family phage tail tape measure protein
VAAKKDILVVLEFDDKGSYKIKKTIGDVSTILAKAGTEAGKAGQGFQKLKTDANLAAGGFDKLKGSFKSTMLSMAAGMGLWTGMSMIMRTISTNLKDIVTKGREFDASFSKVKIMLKGTEEQAFAVKLAVLGMSPALGSASDNAKTLAMSLREFADLSIPVHLKLVEQAAILSATAFTTNELAMEALISTMKGFKIGIGDMGKVSDVLTKAVQLEDVSFEELTKTILKLSSTAYQAGVGMDELVATFLTLTHTGVDSQTAMMQLRMLLQGIIKPSVAASNEARRLGLEWGVAGVKSQGFAKWLSELGRVAQGDVAVLDNLFQGGRTLVGVLNLTSTASKELKDNIAQLKEAFTGGAETQKVFLERMKEVNFWIKMAGEMFKKFKIAIWEGFTSQITKGAASADEIKQRVDVMTKSIITTGLSIGKAISDVIKFFVSFRDTIVTVGKIWFAFWSTKMIAGWATMVVTAINASSSAMITLKFATMAVTTALGTLVTAVGIAIAATQALLWAREKLGLSMDKSGKGMTAEEKKWRDISFALTETATGMKGLSAWEPIANLLGQELQNTWKIAGKGYRDVSPELKKLNDLWNEFGGNTQETLKAIAAGAADKELSDLLSKITKGASDAASSTDTLEKQLKALQDALLGTGDPSGEFGDNLSDQQKKLAALRETLKSYGYTLKTELTERYMTLSQGLATFGSQMTKVDFDRMKKELKELGAVLGKNSQALLNLGILTKTEVSYEVTKITKDFWDLKKEMEAGNITWAQYTSGIDAINEALKKLDPTLTATLNNMTKVAETPLPSPKKMLGETPGLTVPEYGPSPMLTADEVKKALASLGPSIQYLTYLEGLIGAPLKELAKRQLPDFVKNFKAAMAVGGFSAEGLKTAADALIQHYKDAGVEVPAELKKMGSSVLSTWQGVAQAMGEYWSNAMAEMIKSGLNFRDVINIAWQTLAIGAGKVIGNMAEKALSGLGAMAGPVGSLIGSIAGSLISGLGKLFGIKSKAQKEAEKAKKEAEELKRQVASIQKSYKSLGDITEATAKKIAELTKQYNKQTATIMTLTDVMNDAGISMKNLQGYVTKMTQALRDMASGTVDVQKGMDAIGSAFNALITWAQKFDKEGTKALISFMQYLRKIGVSIAEVDAYVFGALEKGAGGLKSMVESVGGSGYKQLITYRDEIKTLGEEVDKLSMSKISERAAQREYLQKKAQLEELRKKYDDLKTSLASGLAPELERVSRLTVAMFSSFIQQGKSMSETFALMGDSLVALRDKYTELGLTGGAAIEDLFKLVDIQKANEGLFEGLEGTRQLLKALGDTGFLTAESLADLATQATGYYDKLISAGLDPKQAMAMVSPTLSDLAYYAEQYGLKLDAGTEMLIAQAKLAGTWKDRGKDINTILEGGFSDLVGRFDRLIKVNEEIRDGQEEGGRGVTRAQHGFEGTVTGPRTFYVEPGVTEAVRIGRPGKAGSGESQVTVIEKNVTFEPVIIPFKHLQSLVIEWVQKASADERILVRPRSVRGRG